MHSFVVLHLPTTSRSVRGFFHCLQKENTFFVFPVFLTAKVYSVIVYSLVDSHLLSAVIGVNVSFLKIRQVGLTFVLVGAFLNSANTF